MVFSCLFPEKDFGATWLLMPSLMFFFKPYVIKPRHLRLFTIP